MILEEYQIKAVEQMARYIDADKLLKKKWDADTRCGYVQVVDIGDINDIAEEMTGGRND